MVFRMKTIKLKINKPLKNYASGSIVDVEVDANNQPINVYWQRRLQDAELDNCVEIVAEKANKNKE